MIKKVQNLNEVELSWAVLKALGNIDHKGHFWCNAGLLEVKLGMYPFVGGSNLIFDILLQNKISVEYKAYNKAPWLAKTGEEIEDALQLGDTPQEAILRCFVEAKLGDEVELPCN